VAGLPDEVINQAGLAVGLEAAVQHATADVAIHEKRAVASVRERERQIGRDE